MNDSSLISGVIGILGGFVAVVVILVVLQILGAWKVFEKAGKPGWHCIIPFLNTYDYFMISGFGSTPAIIGAVGTAVACLITFSGFAGGSGALTGIGTFLSVICWAVSGIMQLMSCFMLPGKFNKGTGAGFLFLFLPAIGMLVAGFSDTWVYGGKDKTVEKKSDE